MCVNTGVMWHMHLYEWVASSRVNNEEWQWNSDKPKNLAKHYQKKIFLEVVKFDIK